MIVLLVPVFAAVGLWVAWNPLKSLVSRGKADDELQSEELRTETLEVQAAVNVVKEANLKAELEIKL